MAKKKKIHLNINNIRQFFKDERVRFTLGILLMFGTLYIVLALVSFMFTGAADQSIVVADDAARSTMKRQVTNWTGALGANIAEAMVNNGFGVSVFVLLIIPVLLSVYLLGVEIKNFWKWIFYPLLFTSWAPFVLDFFFARIMSDSFLSIGGSYGHYISDVLITNIGFPGTLMFIIVSFLIFAAITFSSTIPTLKRLFHRKPKIKLSVSPEHPTLVDEESAAISVANDDDAAVAEVNSEDDSPSVVEILNEDEANPEDSETNSEDAYIDDNIKIINVDSNEETGSVEEHNVSSDQNVSVREVDSVKIESVVAEDGEVVAENLEPYDPTLDLSYYKYPTLNLLKDYPNQTIEVSDEEKRANQIKIINTLKNFGIGVKKIFETIGPTITLYEIVPEDGVRISKIQNLEKDIMLSLAAIGIRIIAPMPGKGTIGIEVPNEKKKIVSMRSVIASKAFQESKMELPVALGRTITNEVFMFDLAKAPHLLVAGATGQGKSVGLNAIITSLLYKKHPSQLKLVLVDPKMVEFSMYRDIDKHFLAQIPDAETPVITDTTQVLATLNSLVEEMEDRYKLLMDAHVRNIKEYNDKFINRHLNPQRGHKYLPYIVVIIDEFGDFIMTAGKEVETPIARIAQKARAVGIHMILATQRPSVNIITGVIKANFPARMAFKVSSGVDSKTILDQSGANQLIGRGDLLYLQGDTPVRVQCAFVDTPEVQQIVGYISDQQGYPSPFELPEPPEQEGDKDLSSVDITKRDPYFEDVAHYVVSSRQGSTSNIQRKYEIGFNRAGRIMDQLEVAGIVGPTRGSKPREVLIGTEYELDQLLNSLH